MKIIITKNYQTMSTRAANLIIKQTKKKKSSVLGLPTGKTPIRLYKILRLAFKNKRVNFINVSIFNLDRYVGLDEKAKNSYYYYMQKYLFKHINIKEKNVHIPDGEARNLKRECLRYEKLIAKKRIDLLILGIGLNGHIGFNEPGSPFNSKTRVVNLSLETRRTNAKYFKSLRVVPKKAITMGIYTIMQARKIILLASGKEKTNIVAQALKGRVNKKIPASYLQFHPNITVILDKKAATKL